LKKSTSSVISNSIFKTIQRRLDKIEKKENVKILYACESGSRAWGFPSKDSDYDVRFIYVHPRNWYLSIETGRDVIERPLVNNIDESGWDLKKALGLLRKSNPPLLEWLDSPIIYKEVPSFSKKIRELVKYYYSAQNCMNHYFHIAERTYKAHLKRPLVKSKKYFYALRPLLACRWIEAGYGPVPMEFAKLVGKVAIEKNIKTEIQTLLERKRFGFETEEEPRNQVLSNFISKELEIFSIRELDKTVNYKNVNRLDDLFLRSI
jgi:predicted nucleotidyltransferase